MSGGSGGGGKSGRGGGGGGSGDGDFPTWSNPEGMPKLGDATNGAYKFEPYRDVTVHLSGNTYAVKDLARKSGLMWGGSAGKNSWQYTGSKKELKTFLKKNEDIFRQMKQKSNVELYIYHV